MQAVLALVVPDHIAQVGHARHDLRGHAARPAEQPHQPNITNPQCNGAAKSSSTNQKAWPHSLSPTLGRIIIGPTTAATNGNETALLNCGSRVMAYRYQETPQVMYNGN